jgi:hypothetical protein
MLTFWYYGLWNREDGSGMLLQNFGIYTQNYEVSKSSRPQSLIITAVETSSHIYSALFTVDSA